jgi:hypothetical protein
MRALKIYESMAFQRGQDPKSAMGLGIFRDYKGISIKKGDSVFVDADIPARFSEFEGTVDGFRSEYVTVEDMDGDFFDVEPYKLTVLKEGYISETANFERGQDPHKALRIGRYSKDILEIVSVDIEIMPEPGNQDTYYNDSLDHYDVIVLLNNWEAHVKDDNYGFWMIEEDENDEPDYYIWKDLEGTTVKYAEEYYDIPKTDYKVKS